MLLVDRWKEVVITMMILMGVGESLLVEVLVLVWLTLVLVVALRQVILGRNFSRPHKRRHRRRVETVTVEGHLVLRLLRPLLQAINHPLLLIVVVKAHRAGQTISGSQKRRPSQVQA